MSMRSRVFKVAVQMKLTWGCENWGTVTKAQEKQLISSNHLMLLRMLNKSYLDRISIGQAAYHTGTFPLDLMISYRRLRALVKILHEDANSISKLVL
jgi:hypothetical protein